MGDDSVKKTILDVAERSGFSKSTVSLAMQSSKLIKEETRNRVLEAARELGYHPNMVARTLKTGVAHAIGLIIPDLLNPYFTDFTQQVENHLLAAGVDMMLSSTNQKAESNRGCIDRMIQRRLDGIIMFVISLDGLTEYLLELRSHYFPCVLIGPPRRDTGIDSIFIDMEPGTYKAIRHLTALGHRRIGFIRGRVPQVYILGRVRGFKRALADSGIAIRDELVIDCGFKIEDGYKAAKQLLRKESPPTAIFALNDLLALGAIRAAKELGLNIPDDVSIVGVDNVKLGRFAQTSLTTVAQPIEDIAKMAVDLLLRRVKEEEWDKVEQIDLKSKLIIRESTGICKSGRLPAESYQEKR